MEIQILIQKQNVQNSETFLAGRVQILKTPNQVSSSC